MTEHVRPITSTHGFGVLASAFGKNNPQKEGRRRDEKPGDPYGQKVIEDQVETSGDINDPETVKTSPSAYKPTAAITVVGLTHLDPNNPDESATLDDLEPMLWSALPLPPTTLSAQDAPSAYP